MTAPPVSYVLTSYDQEAYVREAVRSALAQDYQPLEIIISDDASRDSSFEILKEEVERYRGPHRVVLNRNRENLYLEHVYRLLELAKGRLLIRAHGDDIARPDRARHLAEAWVRNRVPLVTSNATMINAKGEPLGLLSNSPRSGWIRFERVIVGGNLLSTVGATFATDRVLYDRFPRIDRNRYPVGIDHILPFRAGLLRGIYYLSEPLLQYRQHDRSMSSRMVDKTGGREAFDETACAHSVWAQLCRLDELAVFSRQAPDSARLKEIREMLEQRILTLTGLWVGYRSDLRAKGFCLSWLDRDAFDRRVINEKLQISPKLPERRPL